jgi:hypothetical protein
MYSYIMKRTMDLLLEKKLILMKALLIPFLLLCVIEAFSEKNLHALGLYDYFLLFISFLISMAMSINVHRILLLKEEDTPTWGVYKFGKREISFILKGIGLALFLMILFFILSGILTLFGKLLLSFIGNNIIFKIYNIGTLVLTIAFLGTLFSRISLIFPAIATDKPIDFAEALDISKDFKLLSFVMISLFPILFALIVNFVYGIVIKFLMASISQDLDILYSLLNIFITVFTIGFLSVTYEYIISQQSTNKDIKLNETEYYENGDSYKISIDDRHNITFEEIKEILLKQYELLGFTTIKVDKEDSWLLKNPDIEKAYILLSHFENQYIIETFNLSEKPVLNI